MKSITIKTALMTTVIVLFITILTSCNSMKGTASDRTGTNGATNGTGKVAKSL